MGVGFAERRERRRVCTWRRVVVTGARAAGVMPDQLERGGWFVWSKFYVVHTREDREWERRK